MKRIALFGSTGSIGTSTLKIVRENPTLFQITILVARQNIDLLLQQIDEFAPKYVYIFSKENAKTIQEKHPDISVYYGDEGLKEIAEIRDVDLMVSALVGIAGLMPTYTMVHNGIDVALANKEVLVTAGNIITKEAKRTGARLLTIDSEHSAILQCLEGNQTSPVSKILLTASGGPFLDYQDFSSITPEDALCHPTWSMGKKVTIDSSTMMNKGFEVMEAKWLFHVEPKDVEVVIHRQSLVHSMVEFKDGTILANIAPKDMQIPIAYAMNYPNKRLDNSIPKLDLFQIGSLHFQKPDTKKFPCLQHAYDALSIGPKACIACNDADEILVEAFLNHKISYLDIENGIKKAINLADSDPILSIEEVLDYHNEITKKLHLLFQL